MKLVCFKAQCLTFHTGANKPFLGDPSAQVHDRWPPARFAFGVGPGARARERPGLRR